MRTAHAWVVFILVAMALSAQGQNLLTNPGFEAGIDITNAWNWTDSGWVGWNAQRLNWFARQVTNSAVIEQWGTDGQWWDGQLTNTPGGFAQTVLATPTGCYTFAIWILQSTNVNPNHFALALALDFTDSVGVTNEVTRDISALPRDGFWHPVYVTGTNNNPTLTNINVAVSCNWTNSVTQTLITGDDAELYAGNYRGVTNLVNGDLEQRPGEPKWTGSAWVTMPPMDDIYVGGQRMFIWSWSYHSAIASLGLFGGTNIWWYGGAPPLPLGAYETKLSQSVSPGAGTYAFSIWMTKDATFVLTNAELRMEWFDATLTNKVQADTIYRPALPLSASWRSYAVTGTCASAELGELRLSLFVQWQVVAGAQGSMPAMYIDDAGFAVISTSTDGIPNWWWDQYSIPSGGRQVTNRADSDVANNGEEYVADTNPTNADSFFPDATNVVGNGVWTLTLDKSSAARVYDVYWKTNLVQPAEQWLPLGLSVTGNGTVATLTFTNTLPHAFYRSGVRLP